jgi:hypothetical protein
MQRRGKHASTTRGTVFSEWSAPKAYNTTVFVSMMFFNFQETQDASQILEKNTTFSQFSLNHIQNVHQDH